MMPHPVTILTLCSFLGCVALIGRLCQRFCQGNDAAACGAREFAGASLAVLAAFVFIPPGSLPPLFSCAEGAVLCWVLLGLSLALGGGTLQSVSSVAITYGVTLAALAVYVYWRGIPGSPLQLGTYAAMPLWGEVSLAGKLGLLCLCAALARSAALWRAQVCSRAACMQRMLCAALIVVLFIPYGFARAFSRGDIMVLVADFLMFWVKIVCVCLLFPHIRKIRLPHPVLMSLLGAAFLVYDYTGGIRHGLAVGGLLW